MKKKILVSLLTVCATLTMTLTMALSAAAASDKDTLTIGMSAEFETLNPLVAQQAATFFSLYLVYRPLLALNSSSKWVPIIIKEIPTLENKLVKREGKGLSAIYEILEKAKWGDGVPVTCKDLAFAREVALNKNVSIGEREAYEKISSITWDKNNEKKCTFHYAQAKYDYFMDYPDYVPEHLERPVYEKFKDTPQGYDHNTLYTKDPGNPGLYNGPYLISEVKLGSHIVFVPNPYFYGKKPHFKKIIVKLIPNNNTLIANLKSGDIDFINGAAGIGLDQAVPFEKEAAAQNLPYKVVYADGVLYAHIDINLATPGLGDVRVRRAMEYAIDKSQITNSLMYGKPAIASSFVTPTDPWYTDKIQKYEYNKKKANDLLEQAGWKMGDDGIRIKDGKRLSIRITAAAEFKINELIETYLQSQFKAVGIELKLKNEPARVFFGDTLLHRNFDLAFFAWSAFPENSPRSTFHSSMIPSEKNSYSGQNNNGWNNPEVDKLVDAIEVELRPKQRAEIAHKLIMLYADQVPTIPLYFRPTVGVIPADMKNFELAGTKFFETLWAENWTR